MGLMIKLACSPQMLKILQKCVRNICFYTKGQFWCLQFFQKTNENNSTWGIIVLKSNFFVRFLEELRIP